MNNVEAQEATRDYHQGVARLSFASQALATPITDLGKIEEQIDECRQALAIILSSGTYLKQKGLIK